MLGILDAGLIAHVGVTTPDGPLVLPMAYGRDEERLYLHGAAANHLLGTGEGEEICVTVTHVDGLVMARTPFHNSMNYRSVVVRGRATRIDGEKRKRYALQLITDHIVANWDTSRPPSQIDLRRTLVLELPLTEASAKVRAGDPIDEPDRHCRAVVGRRGADQHPLRGAGGLRRLHRRRRAAGGNHRPRRPQPRRPGAAGPRLNGAATGFRPSPE